ncbi:MAG: translation initiation factor IF-2 [Ignavibacteria bacterium GWA2_54_16]|nr:MAG: translation initiation factor IF-2 [Ignavibacteria bacterium GWA2_54_16]
MPETAAKKIKIYKLATELNLSSETLLEFLHKKGFEVKSHMSSVTDEMLSAVMGHFKKEKDVAERHQRKLQEFRTSRKKEPSEKPEKKQAPAETPAAPAPTPEAVEPEPTPEVEKITVAEAPAVEAPVEVLQPEAEKEEAPEEVEEAPAPVLPVAPKAPEPPRVRKPLSPLEQAMARPRMGLTIKGKMQIARPVAPSAAAAEAEDESKKKKKKKKLRAETKKPVGKLPISDDEGEIKAKKRKKSRHAEVDEVQVDKAIRETLAEMVDDSLSARAAIRKKKKKEREEEEQRLLEEKERDKMLIRVTEFVTVGELADLMRVTVAEVIQKCMSLGIMVSINQRLEKDTIQLVADEFGFQVVFETEFTSDALADVEDDEETLKFRPPVVTIMGHVDHGKTSLLDYIRNANVVAGEAGGITQHIGAYEVSLPEGKQITFLDTPGHEAFTAMRARGAQVTDIVVLVVAADDNVMPQTVEAISHAQAASVPIVIAINKIDKSEANPERIKQQLSEKGVLVEEWGGKYQAVPISAKTGLNVDQLMERILLEAELMDLKANPDRLARGVVVESELDRGKGIVATILVQKGTLHIGDSFICGVWSGRARAMFDERGRRVEAAHPSQPVQLVGFDGIPQAGDDLVVLASEREARDISVKRQQLKREQDFRQRRTITLDDISKQIKEGQVKDLLIIVKGDVDGSVEALSDSLMKLSTTEVKVVVIHKGVGGISESDVLLAAASRAVIIGFHVRPNLNARRLSESEEVEIRLYNIIYDAINEVKSALEGMLAPSLSEQVLATIEVRDVFKISRVGTIAGCYVQDGKIIRNNKVRLVRDGLVVFDGTIASLKRFKEDVREVEQGFECGIGLEGFNDIKVGDTVEAYTIVETKRKLA